MQVPYSGGCSCGKIRYECSAAPFAMLNCHCRQCQYASGGASSSGYFVNKDSFKLLQGKPRYYELTADSGNKVRRGFCADCGSPLFAEGDGNPDLLVIKPSSLDDPSWYKPQLDIFTSESQPWDHMDPDIPKFPGMPEM